MINSEKKGFKIRFLTDMLGTVAKDKEVYATYIATKAPSPDNGEAETADVKSIEEKGWTGFLEDDKGLYVKSYMVRGFLKNALKVMQENGAIKKVPAYKTWIDSCVFVSPEKLYFGKKKPDGVCERPLQAMTIQGPRVTLARSDTISEGTQLEFEVEVLKNGKGITVEMITELFDYGKYCGLGQWRGSGGCGRFEVMAG